jgi:hypothetical protein
MMSIGGKPAWLLRHPTLLAAALLALNTSRRSKTWAVLAVALLIAAAVLLALPMTARVLERTAGHVVTVAVLCAVLAGLSSAHWRSAALRGGSDSWLAALPRSTSTGLRMALVRGAQLALCAVALTIPILAGTLAARPALTLLAGCAVGSIVGSCIGWLGRSRRQGMAPDSQYAVVRLPRQVWARAPRLTALAFWPLARARVLSKPKISARSLLFVLLAIPLGTGGAQAIAIAAACLVLLHLVTLTLAGILIAFEAARWLAPTPVRSLRFSATLGAPVLAKQIVTCVLVVLLIAAAPVAAAVPEALAACAAWLGFSAAMLMIACTFACHRAGLRNPAGPRR